MSITQKGRDLKSIARTIPENVGKCIDLNNEEFIILYQLLYKVLENVN